MHVSPALLLYSASMVILCLNMLGLWGYSGTVRSRAKVTPNPEDVASVAKGAQVSLENPAGVARVLRAHTNATANIVPFAILGLLYVLCGGSALWTGIFCGVFTAARLAHTFAYLGEKQPWRSIFFTIGGIDTLAMTGALVWELIAAV